MRQPEDYKHVAEWSLSYLQNDEILMVDLIDSIDEFESIKNLEE